MAICGKCKMNQRRPHGHYCNMCENALKRERYKANPDKYKKANEQYYDLQKRKIDYEKNKDRELKRNKQYRKDNYAKTLYNYAKRRARDKNIVFDISVIDIQNALHEANWQCPILGIPLRIATKRMDPNSPSLDRINNNKGYTVDNIHIISNRANILKRDASLDEIRQLFCWMQNNQGGV